MINSIRWRLQFWYALVLAGVIASFALILYHEVRSARLQEIDADLASAANYLDSVLRNFQPRAGFDDPQPPPKKDWDRFGKKDGPPGKEGLGKEGPPGRKGGGPMPVERFIGELTPPGWPTESTELKERYYAIWRNEGTFIKALDLPTGTTKPGPWEELSDYPEYGWRDKYRQVIMLGPRHDVILVGRDTGKLGNELEAFAWQLGMAGAGVLLVGLIGGWFFASRIVRPITRISETASRISGDNLTERIDTKHIDRELAELGEVLNGTFDRLEIAFDQQTRFTADASHELRTPLAIIKSHAELALCRERTPEQYRQTIEACRKAADRMVAIVDGLLVLARTDAGQLALNREPVDLGELVEESIRLLRPLAHEKGIRFITKLESSTISGDSGSLAQLVRNLVNNAINYNLPDGEVRITVRRREKSVVLKVTDTGIGIPAADRPHIFERFYRVDKARARASGGTGLGLAICKSIVDAHEGEIRFTCESGSTIFRVELPLKHSERVRNLPSLIGNSSGEIPEET